MSSTGSPLEENAGNIEERKNFVIGAFVDTNFRLWTCPNFDLEVCIDDRGRFRGAVCGWRSENPDDLNEILLHSTVLKSDCVVT